MSHNLRTRILWVGGTSLLAAEMADLDQKTFTAISEDGGTWASVTPIVIGGAGSTLKLVGTNTLPSGSLNISGTAAITTTVNANAVWGGLTYFQSGSVAHAQSGSSFIFDSGSINAFKGVTTYESGSAVTLKSGTSWVAQSGAAITLNSGSFLTVNCDASFSGICYFFGATTISGLLNISNANNVTVNGTTTLNGTTNAATVNAANIAVSSVSTLNNVTVTGSSTINAPMLFNGAGRPRRVAVFTITSGSGTISPTVATTYLGQALTGNVTLQIDDTNAFDGDEINIRNSSPTYDMNILNTAGSGGGLIALLKSVSTAYNSIQLTRIGGLWYKTRYDFNA